MKYIVKKIFQEAVPVSVNSDMGRIIGTNNESVIRIITRGYSNEIVTAFPKW